MEFYKYREEVYLTALRKHHVRFHIEILYLKKETKCGWWISPYKEDDNQWEHMRSQRRWVSKTSFKRYAYPTKQEAWNSFKYRKRHQCRIITNQLKNVEVVWAYIKDMKEAPKGMC